MTTVGMKDLKVGDVIRKEKGDPVETWIPSHFTGWGVQGDWTLVKITQRLKGWLLFLVGEYVIIHISKPDFHNRTLISCVGLRNPLLKLAFECYRPKKPYNVLFHVTPEYSLYLREKREKRRDEVALWDLITLVDSSQTCYLVTHITYQEEDKVIFHCSIFRQDNSQKIITEVVFASDPHEKFNVIGTGGRKWNIKDEEN